MRRRRTGSFALSGGGSKGLAARGGVRLLRNMIRLRYVACLSDSCCCRDTLRRARSVRLRTHPSVGDCLLSVARCPLLIGGGVALPLDRCVRRGKAGYRCVASRAPAIAHSLPLLLK